jgi:hypothetical protein
MLSFVAMVMTSRGFFLTSHREVAYTLHITDDTCQIVDVVAMAFRAFLKVMLAYMAALVAYCIRNVECEVVASLLSGYTQELAVLCLGEMFFKVKVKG